MAKREAKHDWMALVRYDGNKREDWEIVGSNMTRKAAVKAAEERCKTLGVDYEWGYKFHDGEQQLCYADGYDGSPILGKIVHQTDHRDVVHSAPLHAVGVFTIGGCR